MSKAYRATASFNSCDRRVLAPRKQSQLAARQGVERPLSKHMDGHKKHDKTQKILDSVVRILQHCPALVFWCIFVFFVAIPLCQGSRLTSRKSDRGAPAGAVLDFEGSGGPQRRCSLREYQPPANSVCPLGSIVSGIEKPEYADRAQFSIRV